MIEIEYGKKFKQSIILALGFFDSIHNGHRKILSIAVNEAKKQNCFSAVMTFKNNPYGELAYHKKLVYSYDERLLLLEKFGINLVLWAEFNNNFKNISADKFLEMLTDNLDIKGIICGYDFMYGNNCGGNTFTLEKYCKANNIPITIVEEQKNAEGKISSTAIRNFLSKGEIISANNMLGERYFIKGKVLHGKKIGSKMLFPTINIQADKDKTEIKEGVYATVTKIDENQYLSVTNCGAKPTFNDNDYNIETHVIDYKGDLYGKTVYVYFFDRIRDIIRFENSSDLKSQIEKDINKAKEVIK